MRRLAVRPARDSLHSNQKRLYVLISLPQYLQSTCSGQGSSTRTRLGTRPREVLAPCAFHPPGAAAWAWPCFHAHLPLPRTVLPPPQGKPIHSLLGTKGERSKEGAPVPLRLLGSCAPLGSILRSQSVWGLGTAVGERRAVHVSPMMARGSSTAPEPGRFVQAVRGPGFISTATGVYQPEL